MKNYITPSQYKTRPKSLRTEPNSSLPSQAVPNEAITIPEMLERFTRNQPITTQVKTPVWSENPRIDDTDLEKMNRADLYDKKEFANELGDKIVEMKKDLAAKDAKDKASREEAEEKAFQEKLKKHEKKNIVTPPKDDKGVTPH